MSHDFAVWKRSATTKTAMLDEAYAAICAAEGHAAVDAFDTEALQRELLAHYGVVGADDLPFALETGESDGSSWVVLNCPGSGAEEVRDVLLPLALGRGLLVYDPQREVVWGNRRAR